MIQCSLWLRRALQADAIFSGFSAVALALGAAPLAPWLNLPEALLQETGLFLIAYALFVGWLGSRRSMAAAWAMLVIAGNAAWVLASVALLLSGMVAPNGLGVAAMLAQALVVGVLAELQTIGLRRSRALIEGQPA